MNDLYRNAARRIADALTQIPGLQEGSCSAFEGGVDIRIGTTRTVVFLDGRASEFVRAIEALAAPDADPFAMMGQRSEQDLRRAKTLIDKLRGDASPALTPEALHQIAITEGRGALLAEIRRDLLRAARQGDLSVRVRIGERTEVAASVAAQLRAEGFGVATDGDDMIVMVRT